jgi:hypothetical protein
LIQYLKVFFIRSITPIFILNLFTKKKRSRKLKLSIKIERDKYIFSAVSLKILFFVLKLQILRKIKPEKE